jgi:hypothetical protein
MLRPPRVLCCFLALASLAGPVFAQDAGPNATFRRIELKPESFTLTGPGARQRLLVTGYTVEGRPVDLTRDAMFEAADSTILTVDGSGVVGSLKDGSTKVVARVGKLSASAAAVAIDSHRPRKISFQNEILPILTKAGCNSGGCHGKASGQNGFKLSVFGFDAQFDYDALLKEGRGRRVFPAAPEQSLILRKASGQVAHGGGQRFSADSPAYETLRQWIEAGAPFGSSDDPKVVRLEVWPTERELAPRLQQQLLATATYSDGTRRDVTAQSEYGSNVEPIAGVDEAGLVQASDVPGEAAIMVRYMGEVAVSRIIRPRGEAIETAKLPVNNFIDSLVWDKLRKLAIEPSGLCTDAEFLRRVSLDTIGTLPTVDEARTFLNDPDPGKRAKLIEQLLTRTEFADFWALRWGDLLRLDSAAITQKGAYVFHRWLRDAMSSNMPYDQMVRAIVTAQGDLSQNGPANLYRAVKTPDELANTVSQVFLGIRIECAQCHHHPYERWGQDDFYGLAAYFSQLKRKTGQRGQDVILASNTGDVKHPITKAIVPPHPLGVAPAELDAADDRRAALADWLTSRENPYLARMVSNRIWAHYLGRGLVEPVDDMRTTNPASNEPLLEALAKYTVEHNFDLRALMRVILNSRVYQLSSQTNGTNALDTQNFSHATIKSVPAEVLLDAISQATESAEKFEGLPLGVRAIQLWDSRLPSYFLETFGKPVRASVCECERSPEPSMTQALHLLNSPGIERKVSSPTGRVRRLVDAGKSSAELIDELYLATLSRLPTDDERRELVSVLSTRPDRQRAAEDVLWALMNSREFVFNR